jgi:hypothetical protein
MSRIYLTALAVVALAATSHAELIHFNDRGLARLAYIPPNGDPRTHTQVWADVSLTMDNSTGLLNIYSVEVPDVNGAVGYSLPAQTLQLAPNSIGWTLEHDYAGLPWRTSFFWNNSKWTMAMLTLHKNSGIPFTAEMKPQYPGLTAFDFQGVTVSAPEPAGVVLGVMCASALCGVYRRSGRCG